MEDSFIKAWKSVTKNIYQERGSLGSRLHTESTGVYIAYAQWPSLEQSNLKVETTDKYEKDLKEMNSYLDSSEVLYRLDVKEDLLKNSPHTK